jgi:tRNA pseudouridine55 synthase
VNGVLVIDKPAGPTSHDVVAVVRRAIGLTRVGHTGTLDPLATGVLPLVVGSATRLASFMSGADKEYVAKIRIGASTETYDAETGGSRVNGRSEIPERIPAVSALTEAAVAEAVSTFAGRYLQTPPAYSAKKVGGTPAYKLARQGKPVDVKPVEVTVTEIELRSYVEGLADVRLVCSSGFYVRSLAHDLGQRLGCGAHLEGLQRTRAGAFRLEDALPLGDLVAEGPAAARRTLIPMSGLLTHLSAVVLTETGAERARHGAQLRPQDVTQSTLPSERAVGGPVRLLDGDGSLVGLADATPDGLLHPVVVLV